MPSWALSNIGYDSTWLLVEDLVIIIKRLEARMARNSRSQGFSETFSSSSDMVPWSADFKPNQPWESLGNDYAIFQRELSDITRRAGESASSDEAFDAHLAVGWTLCDHFLLDQALFSLKKAHEIKPRDPRPLFHLGNAFYSAGSYAKATEHYDLALSNGSFAEMENARIRPLLHVNMGIVLEAEGLLLNACEQYEKALSFAPKHPRALKLLGSCLYGVGEYRRAEKVLTEAIDASPGFADAHCDLASALHAIGEDDERAICEFQKALDLKPDHVDALYNFAGLFKDMGRYQRAAEMYSKVLVLQPNNWRAQLNRGVVLLGAGEAEESRKAFKEAFKLTNRVELYDAIEHLRLSKKAQRKHSGKASSSVSGEVKDQATGGGGRSRRRRRRRRRRNEEAGESSEAMIRVDPSQFRRANERTTPSKWLVNALAIRQFQLRTRLHRCDVGRVQDEFFSAKCSGSKPSIEKVLRRLLHFLTPSAFQGAVRAVNERILCVLDSGGAGGEGTVDVGMLLALVSPICAGSTEQRKKTAFDALVWRTADTESELQQQEKKVEKKDGDELRRGDVLLYMKLLHAIYLPKDGMSQAQEVHGGGEGPSLSFAEFVGIFDDHDWGFGLLNVLAKLESSDRVRQIGRACAACAYPITGPWFWEITDKFDLCSLCYSQGKLPASASPRQDSHYYCFKEYRSKFAAVKDRLSLSRSKSLNLS
jgi:tetratricopeptide (TPR) repeat protein